MPVKSLLAVKSLTAEEFTDIAAVFPLSISPRGEGDIYGFLLPVREAEGLARRIGVAIHYRIDGTDFYAKLQSLERYAFDCKDQRYKEPFLCGELVILKPVQVFTSTPIPPC